MRGTIAKAWGWGEKGAGRLQLWTITGTLWIYCRRNTTASEIWMAVSTTWKKGKFLNQSVTQLFHFIKTAQYKNWSRPVFFFLLHSYYQPSLNCFQPVNNSYLVHARFEFFPLFLLICLNSLCGDLNSHHCWPRIDDTVFLTIWGWAAEKEGSGGRQDTKKHGNSTMRATK